MDTHPIQVFDCLSASGRVSFTVMSGCEWQKEPFHCTLRGSGAVTEFRGRAVCPCLNENVAWKEFPETQSRLPLNSRICSEVVLCKASGLSGLPKLLLKAA